MEIHRTIHSKNIFFSALSVGGVGLAVMLGWVTDSSFLTHIHPAFFSMKFSTALCFSLASGALILLHFNYRFFASLLSLAIFLISCGVLIEGALTLPVAIDITMVNNLPHVGRDIASRMSTPTAIGFTLTSLCIFLIQVHSVKAVIILYSAFNGIILAEGIIGLLEYILNIFIDIKWQQFAGMALHTALCFVGLGVIFLLQLLVTTRKEQQLTCILATAASTTMYLGLSVSIAVNNQLVGSNRAIVDMAVLHEIEKIESNLNAFIKTSQYFSTINNMTPVVTTQNERISEWKSRALLYIDDFNFVDQLTLTSATNTQQWHVTPSKVDNTNAQFLYRSLPSSLWLDALSLLKKKDEAIYFLGSDSPPKNHRLYIIQNVNQISGGDKQPLLIATINLNTIFEPLLALLAQHQYGLMVRHDDVTILNSFIKRDAQKIERLAENNVPLNNVLLKVYTGSEAFIWWKNIGLLPVAIFLATSLLTFLLVLALSAIDRIRKFVHRIEIEKEHFKHVVLSSPGAMLIAGNDGTLDLINTKAEELFGYNHNELLGKPLDILLPKNNRAAHQQQFDSFLDHTSDREMAKNRSVFGIDKQGNKIPLEIYLSSIETNNGKKVIASIFDLTDKNHQIEKLQKIQNDLNRTSRIASIGGWEINLETNHLEWSEETYRIHGVDRTFEPNIATAIDFYAPESKPVIEAAVTHAMATGEGWDDEFKFIQATGKHIWVRAIGEVEQRDGQPIRLVGTFQDITEKKHIIEQLERSNAELDQFAYIASHDLKAPLRGIDQLASWLHEDLHGSISEESEGYLKLMRSRISRMEYLLRDLLAYARAGKKEGTPEHIDTHELVQSVFDLCNTREDFTLKIINILPVIETPRAPFELVVRNLITNSIKHHDSPNGEIIVRAFSVSDKYVFEFADNGPGIPTDQQERVFTMFQTLKPRDQVEGSGMGLAIIKKTVGSFGGSVTAAHNTPHGVKFNFSWPKKIT